MPRQLRLDATNALHRVMVRGRERRVIFRDETDRADFVTRLAGLAEVGALGGFRRRPAPVQGMAPQSIHRATVCSAARAKEWAPFLKR